MTDTTIKIKTYLNSVWLWGKSTPLSGQISLSTWGQILTGHLWCSLKKYWHLSVWVPKVTVWCVTCICVTFSSVSPSLMSLTFIFQKWWTNWDLSLVWCMCEGKLKPWLCDFCYPQSSLQIHKRGHSLKNDSLCSGESTVTERNNPQVCKRWKIKENIYPMSSSS